MRAPPQLRGSVGVRVASLFAGLVLCAAGIVGLLESKLGLSPWDVLHQGISRHTPLSFGVANVVVAGAVLGIAWLLGARIGFGTLANALCIGLFVWLLSSLRAVAHLTHEPLGVRVAMLLGGIALMGAGTGFYLGAGFGAGPRDSLMVVGAVRSGLRIGAVRGGLELLALGAGAALGGTVGVGTLAFALLIGPACEGAFLVLRLVNLCEPALAVPEGAAA